jgi:hypothetical protein
VRVLRIYVACFIVICTSFIPNCSAQIQDQVTFTTKDYPCDLTSDGKPLGRLSPGKPLTITMGRGREYLIECTTDVGVKLYSRDYLSSRTDFFNGSLPTHMDVVPVAVLPNLVKAAAAGNVEVTADTLSESLECNEGKSNPSEPWADNSKQIIPAKRVSIPKGTKVNVLPDKPLHCGNTNLIRLNVSGEKAWFPNKDFVFTYKDRSIGVFPPSQDYACCWIE